MSSIQQSPYRFVPTVSNAEDVSDDWSDDFASGGTGDAAAVTLTQATLRPPSMGAGAQVINLYRADVGKYSSFC